MKIIVNITDIFGNKIKEFFVEDWSADGEHPEWTATEMANRINDSCNYEEWSK